MHPTGMHSCFQYFCDLCVAQMVCYAVADLGFPRGGGANSSVGGGGANIPKFSQKLHEIERIWAPGGARPKFYYVDPPLL